MNDHDGTANRWRSAAACAGLEVSMFYTERTGTAHAALAVCAACPVRAECLDDALAAEREVSIQEIFGVRGGMSAIGRRARRAQGLDRIHPGDGDPRHGTLNGYCNLMCRCDACRSAAREYDRARRSRASTSDPEARP